MTRLHSRFAFWGGLSFYAISFSLTAFRGHDGIRLSDSPSVAEWIFDAFLTPLIYANWNSVGSLFEELNIPKTSYFLNGWINPIFLVVMFFMILGKTPRLTRVLRFITLPLVPFCWVAVFYQRAYPREGYILWSVGMLLALFSSSLDVRQSETHPVSA